MRVFNVQISCAVSNDEQMTESDVVGWLLKQLRGFPIDVLRIQVDEQRNPIVWIPGMTISKPTPIRDEAKKLGKAIFDQTFKPIPTIHGEEGEELTVEEFSKAFKLEKIEPAKPRDEKWPTMPPPGIGCTCQVLHMVIPPEGMTVYCPVHGDRFVRGSSITCSEGKHD